MQSGADSVLRRMSRRCRSGEFLALLKQARAMVPELNVTTDIIVGFPGETGEEWQQTLAFVEAAGFGDIHIFAFSPRAGTKAAEAGNPVPREVKRRRSEELHRLAELLRLRAQERLLDKRVSVLVEGSPEDGENHLRWSGYTPDYQRIRFHGPPNLENRLVDIQVEAIRDGLLEGSMPLQHG